MPGLGQVYTGDLPRGIIWILLTQAISVSGLLLLRIPSDLAWELGCACLVAQLSVWVLAAGDAYQLTLITRSEYVLKDYNKWYVYFALVLLGTGSSLAYGIYVRDQLFRAWYVPTDGMFPTILAGDGVLSVNLTSDPVRGDIVLFPNPDQRGNSFVKRVVAVAGDTVEIKNNRLLINGTELPSSEVRQSEYVRNSHKFSGEIAFENNNGVSYSIFISDPNSSLANMPIMTVPKYHCFVLGDNRDNSLDSRAFGPVPMSAIQWKLKYRWFEPIYDWSRLGKIEQRN